MEPGANSVPFTEQGMPTHQQLVLPILLAVDSLGGSAKTQEIIETVLEHLPHADALLQVAYPNRPQDSVLISRLAWGRSTAKRIGALEQPAQGMYLLTEVGEEFIIYLLRRQGLQLQHTGGSGDEGVDAIGTAPLSPVLSSRVAVQIKRYAPEGKPIGRETVALFQRDAQTKGAERAIIVTLSRFTEPARKAATSTVPTVDLISGDRLAELIRPFGASCAEAMDLKHLP